MTSSGNVKHEHNSGHKLATQLCQSMLALLVHTFSLDIIMNYGVCSGTSHDACRHWVMYCDKIFHGVPSFKLHLFFRRYNKAHISTRNSIERAFAVWKRMFPCLTKKLATKLETTVAVITATAVLYNMCRKRNLLPMPDETEEVDSEAVGSAADDRLGVAARRAFIQRHFSC